MLNNNDSGVWKGEERRSDERLQFDKTGEKCEQVFDGIKMRTEEVLERAVGQEAVFSSSSEDIMATMVPEIILKQGSVTVRESNDDKYGNALISRDKDSGDFIPAEISDGSQIVVKKIPALSIPETPINPEEVDARTDRGELRFEYTPSKTMALSKFKDGAWTDVQFIPSGSIETGPLADRYGQSIFGGSRALKLNNGQVALFRPDAHARRFNNNAERECMPHLTDEQLISVYKEVVMANMQYVGQTGKQSLYLAPGLRATKNQLGVKPNSEYLFTCLGVPAGKIFSTPAKLKMETQFHRAAKGGFGNVKHAGNYSPTFAVKKEAHAENYDDLIFLDERNEEIRELSSSNIFFVTKDGTLVTPSMSGEILPGITRDSILQIAEELIEQGIISGAEERTIRKEELSDMTEAFSCGTGVTINGIERIDAPDTMSSEFDVSQGGMGKITKVIYDKFNKILSGEEVNNPRYKDWLLIVE